MRHLYARGTALAVAVTVFGAVHPSTADDSCTVKINKNTYDGPDYWGTVSFISANALTAPSVSFTVPSGVTCAHDYDPAGWTHTQSGPVCTYQAGLSIKVTPNMPYTINYSTDSSRSFAAQNVVVSSASCGSTNSK
jgi:chitosanase